MARPPKSHKRSAEAPANAAEAPAAPSVELAEEAAPSGAAPSVERAEEAAPSAEPAAEAAGRSSVKRARPAESHITDDLAFPASSIARIVKACIPESMNLSKDARTAFGRAATIFALYVTSCANDLCRDGKRSTISATDVYRALDELEFETFTPQVKEFVEAFRSAQAAKKGKSEAGQAAREQEDDDEEEAAEPADEPAADNDIPVC
jgi:DNA polymerase epsilon subunit 3